MPETPQTLGCPDCGQLLSMMHAPGCPRGPGYVSAISPGPFELLSDLRRAGWRVAVHNDYTYKSTLFTFWLFTHSTGVFVRGEAATDLEALRTVVSEIKRRGLTFGTFLADIGTKSNDDDVGTKTIIGRR